MDGVAISLLKVVVVRKMLRAMDWRNGIMAGRREVVNRRPLLHHRAVLSKLRYFDWGLKVEGAFEIIA